MNQAAIATYGLTKFYGEVRAVHDLNLRVERGEIFGFLGPNGAGKTTTIRLLLDLIRPTRGRAEILGLDTHHQAQKVHAQIGYLPGDLSLYPSLTGEGLLSFLDKFREGDHRNRYRALADRLDLDLKKPIRAYSRGMEQKLGLIQALAPDPALLILDEPTSGLDPLVQMEVYEILRAERDRGTTVFFSSHILPEVERICDRVGIIRQGELVTVESVPGLRSRRGHRVELTLHEPVDRTDLERVEGVQILSVSGNRAVFTYQGPIPPLLAHLATLPVEDLVFAEPSLEEVFMSFYREEAPVEKGRA